MTCSNKSPRLDSNQGNCNYMVYFLDLWATTVPVCKAFCAAWKYKSIASNIRNTQSNEQCRVGRYVNIFQQATISPTTANIFMQTCAVVLHAVFFCCLWHCWPLLSSSSHLFFGGRPLNWENKIKKTAMYQPIANIFVQSPNPR